jgi:hypothetical protein
MAFFHAGITSLDIEHSLSNALVARALSPLAALLHGYDELRMAF